MEAWRTAVAHILQSPDSMMMRHSPHDVASFKAEVLPLRPQLYALALRYTRNDRDADDLVQDTMLKAFVAWDSFVPGTNARSWCFRILTNTFITETRRRGTVRRAASQETEGLTRTTSTASRRLAETPERAVVDAELSDEVIAALGQLPGSFREVLMLCDVHGKSYKEIARITNSPLGTVMSRLHRARSALRHALGDYARTFGIGQQAVAA